MPTVPVGDDIDTRRSVMAALTRAVARQRMATTAARGSKPRKKLSATYTPKPAPRAVRP